MHPTLKDCYVVTELLAMFAYWGKQASSKPAAVGKDSPYVKPQKKVLFRRNGKAHNLSVSFPPND